MQAYRLDQLGSLEGLGRHEQDTPAPGQGQVLVRVRARSLNYRDLLILQQRYAFQASPGVVPLSDGAGEVVALGGGVICQDPGRAGRAITSSQRKEAIVRSLGSDDVVDRALYPQWAAEVRRLTRGAGVDHVVETGAIDTLPQSLAACAANAEVALVAALGQGALDAAALRGLVTIRRVFVGSRASFEYMNRAIVQHRVEPVIDRVFAFGEARVAYEHFAARRHVGKVVVADA